MSILTDDQINQIMGGFYLNRPDSGFNRSASVNVHVRPLRWGFVRRHRRSLAIRWQVLDGVRRNLYSGSPVAYILGLPC